MKMVFYVMLIGVSLVSCKKTTPTEKILSMYQETFEKLPTIQSVEDFNKLVQESNERLAEIKKDDKDYKFSEQEIQQINEKYEEFNRRLDKRYAELAYGETIHWMYTKDTDDLTGATTAYNATIASLNEIPVRGSKTTRLAIRLSYSTAFTSTPRNSFMIVFYDNKGMAHFADFQGRGMRVIFDDGDVDNTWTSMDYGSHEDALVSYWNETKVSQFINKLRQSKKCRIQVNIQDIGLKTFDFDVSGLEWTH